jgi:TolB protein
VSEAVPVAVVPFAYEGRGEAPLDVASLVAGNLHRSGRFAPIDRTDMISQPTRARDVNFTDWRLLKTDYVIIGAVTEDGLDRYTVRFQVFDVYRGRVLDTGRVRKRRPPRRPEPAQARGRRCGRRQSRRHRRIHAAADVTGLVA